MCTDMSGFHLRLPGSDFDPWEQAASELPKLAAVAGERSGTTGVNCYAAVIMQTSTC